MQSMAMAAPPKRNTTILKTILKICGLSFVGDSPVVRLRTTFSARALARQCASVVPHQKMTVNY